MPTNDINQEILDELKIVAGLLEEWHGDDAHRALNSGKYVDDEWYEFSITWPTTGRKITYTADNADEYLRLVELSKRARDQEAEMSLRIYQRQRRTLKWDKYKAEADKLVERAKTDTHVISLLEKAGKDISFLDTLSILVSPYLKCGRGRFDEGPNQLRVGFCAVDEQSGVETMYDALLHQLAFVLQRKSSTEERPKIWRYLQRPDQAASIADTVKLFKDRGDSEQKVVDWLLQHYEAVGMTEESAKQLYSNAAQLIEEASRYSESYDPILWKQGKMSVRAINQFRQKAPYRLQEAVNDLLDRQLLKEAAYLVRPYLAYRVQAATDVTTRSVAVDFDNVVAEVTADRIGKPITGAIDALWQLTSKGDRVILLSSLAASDQGKQAIKDWLDTYGSPNVTVIGTKLPPLLYLEGNSTRFTEWSTDLTNLLSDEKQISLTCSQDLTAKEWDDTAGVYECPACLASTQLLETVPTVLYQLNSGDKVDISSVNGNLLSDACLVCKADDSAEKILKASNLWIVRLADGNCVPVAENFLTKTGFDLDSKQVAATILKDKKTTVGEVTPLKYDIDQVLETVLKDVKANQTPIDVAILKVTTANELESDDIDFLNETLLGDEDDVVPQKPKSDFGVDYATMVNAIKDALAETDAFFAEENKTPNEEDEVSMVMGYLAEEFNWTDELLDDTLIDRIRELIDKVREEEKVLVGALGGLRLQSPRWILTEADRQLWNELSKQSNYSPVVTIKAFRSKKVAAQEKFTLRQMQIVWDFVRSGDGENASAVAQLMAENPEENLSPHVWEFLLNEANGIYNTGIVYDEWKDVIKEGFKSTTSEVTEYMPTATPSLTSVPESEYDVVRQQTEADSKFTDEQKQIVWDLVTGGDGDDAVKAAEQLIADHPNMNLSLYEWARLVEEANGIYHYGNVPIDWRRIVKSNASLNSAGVRQQTVAEQRTALTRPEDKWFPGEKVDTSTVNQLFVNATPEQQANVASVLSRITGGNDQFETIDFTSPSKDRFISEVSSLIDTLDDNKLDTIYWLLTKQAILHNSLKGLKLTANQRKVVAYVYEDIANYEPEFLKSVGQIFGYDWDPGSSWEVVEANGKKQLVRKDPPKKEKKMTKHCFSQGQVVKMFNSFYPSDVKIVELLGDTRYRVKSELDGTIADVDESELLIEDNQLF